MVDNLLKEEFIQINDVHIIIINAIQAEDYKKHYISDSFTETEKIIFIIKNSEIIQKSAVSLF